MKRSRPAGLFKAGHRDANHAKLSEFLSHLGGEPIDTSKVGGGFPDCVQSIQGITVMWEFKGEKGTLTPPQVRFIDEWRGGPLYVVKNEDDILRALKDIEFRNATRRRVSG